MTPRIQYIDMLGRKMAAILKIQNGRLKVVEKNATQ